MVAIADVIVLHRFSDYSLQLRFVWFDTQHNIAALFSQSPWNWVKVHEFKKVLKYFFLILDENITNRGGILISYNILCVGEIKA